MTGLTRSSAELDIRRKRALYRAWHRGMREMDLVLGTYAEQEIGSMSDSVLVRFEALLREDDSELNAWITGQDPIPPEKDRELLLLVREHYLNQTR